MICKFPRLRDPILCLSLLALLAMHAHAQQLGAPVSIAAEQNAPDDADAMLRRAALQLVSYRSISANLRQRVDMYGRRLVGSGIYRQLNTSRDVMFRTELKVSVADTISTLLQVSDGRVLSTYRVLPGEQIEQGPHTELTQVDLHEVRQKTGPMSAMSWGGLPGMLELARFEYEFSPPETSQLHGAAVFVLSGKRKPREHSAASPTPPHVPDAMTITLAREDLFPYRLDFFRRRSEDEAAGQGTGSAASSRAIMTLELFEVELDAPMTAQIFHLPAVNVPYVDATPEFLDNLEARRDGVNPGRRR